MGRRPLKNLPEWAQEVDKKEYRAHVRWLRRLLREACVTRTPMINMRIDEASRQRILAKFLERKLNALAQSDSDPEANPRPYIMLAEAIGKAYERWREAVFDLVPNIEKERMPARLGLPDIMKPIIKKAGNLYDEMLARCKDHPPDPLEPATTTQIENPELRVSEQTGNTQPDRVHVPSGVRLKVESVTPSQG